MKEKRKIIALGLLLSLLMLSGCWDSKEVENLAVTTLIAWDRVDIEGQPKWQITTRIMNMAEQQSKGAEEKSTAQEILIIGTGDTIQEAFNSLAKRVPASIFYEHSVGLVFGERVAREELTTVMDNTLRFPSSRVRDNVLVCKGMAAEILTAQPLLSSTLSKQIRKTADRTVEEAGVSYKVTVLDFSKQLVNKKRDTVLPLVKVYEKKQEEEIPEKTLEIAGFGVIREKELVGWLEGEEAKIYVLILGKPQYPHIPFNLQYDDNKLNYSIYKSKSKVAAKVIEGVPQYYLKVSVEGVIHETTKSDLSIEDRAPLEKVIEEKILEEVLQLVDKAREYDADIFGFNEYLYRYHPKEWQAIEPNWREHFQKAEIDVEVEAKIRSFGVTNKGIDI